MDYLAILVASVVQFIIGAVWYTPIFGKQWAKIHGFDGLTPEMQRSAMKDIPPLLGIQFVLTIVTTVVLSMMLKYLPINWNAYELAALIWIGFSIPTQVSAVLFGGTKPEWFVQKILIMAGASLLCLEAAALVLTFI